MNHYKISIIFGVFSVCIIAFVLITLYSMFYDNKDIKTIKTIKQGENHKMEKLIKKIIQDSEVKNINGVIILECKNSLSIKEQSKIKYYLENIFGKDKKFFAVIFLPPHQKNVQLDILKNIVNKVWKNIMLC